MILINWKIDIWDIFTRKSLDGEDQASVYCLRSPISYRSWLNDISFKLDFLNFEASSNAERF